MIIFIGTFIIGFIVDRITKKIVFYAINRGTKLLTYHHFNPLNRQAFFELVDWVLI